MTTTNTSTGLLPFFKSIEQRLAAPAQLPRQIAVPPVRDAPNEHATEFVWSAFGQLAAGGAFVSLTDPTTSAAFIQNLGSAYRGRIDSMLLYCPDMVTAVAPYLFASLRLGNSPSSAWGNVPIYPRSGVASLAFDTVIDVPPNINVTLFGENTDAVNAHFLGVYLHGWYWPVTLQEG